MVSLNPLDIILWTFRRSGRDIVKLYDSLSPVMQLATGGDMLNFGYWTDAISDPITAQQKLCAYVGELAELSSAKKVLDIGSGLAAPAKFWRAAYKSPDITCFNINFSQLVTSGRICVVDDQSSKNIELVNATSTVLPLADSSVDRVVALEAAQHFRPIEDFVTESARVLESGGLLVIAIPIVSSKNTMQFLKLGVLSFTWSSEHYTVEQVQSPILRNGLSIINLSHIGHLVYEPLADYYIRNRTELRDRILKMYPSYVEKILYRSILKMRKLSSKEMIEYVVIKAQKK
jgi:ubiquinone/menaquinone biosynthesis C-methylase UbiE